MNKNITATVIGSTGLIGKEIVNILDKDEFFHKINLIVRKPVEVKSDKFNVKLIDFENLDQFKKALEGSNAVFCAIGTTKRKVKGDKKEYRKVDYDIAVNAARFAKEASCENYLLVSSVGANSNSFNFYTRLKGEIEDDIVKIGLKSFSIFRPSLLLGKRDEYRFAESLGKYFMKALTFLMPMKYRAIEARKVAKAMVSIAKAPREGVSVYHYKDMV
jgi:uncharacterized protein YbjT (DUF2867 family)